MQQRRLADKAERNSVEVGLVAQFYASQVEADKGGIMPANVLNIGTLEGVVLPVGNQPLEFGG